MIVGILIPLLLIPTSVKAHMGHSFPTGEWIEKIRNHEAQLNRISIDEMLNNTLMEYENGSNGSTKSEELLQLPSNED